MLAVLLCSFVTPALANVKNSGIVEVKRQVAAYHKVKVNGPFEVTLVYGQPGEITIEGNNNIVGTISTLVADGTLTITANGQAIKPGKKNHVTITVPYTLLDEVALTGSGTITAKKQIENDSFKVTLDGSGKINVAVVSGNVKACLLGSGVIRINGSTENFDCSVVGTGNIKAASLKAANVTAVVSGTGDVSTTSTKAIKGRISGAGNIAFAGEPAKTDLRHTGEGNFVY
jgi:hypothetical protein